MALSLELGRFVAGLRYEEIPADVREAIKTAFADTIGVAVAGSMEPAAQIVKSIVTPGSGEATLLGRQGRASAIDAAWINGTAAHALDYDDISQRAIGHVSSALVPAVLAEAEAVGASGQQMLTAYAAGYETIADLVLRDADLDKFHIKGWQPTGVFGAVACAAACASLRGFSPEQAARAMGVAASQSAGLVANFGTMTKPLHAGKAAHSGLVAAHLVRGGFTGAEDVFEHAPGFLHAFSYGGRIDLERPVRAGIDWHITSDNRISVKKYPICYCTHRCIDGVFDLLAKTPVKVEDVERIDASVSKRNAIILHQHSPTTGLEAKFSLEFAVVAPIIAGRVGIAELSDKFVKRADVQAMMKRVVTTLDPIEDPDQAGYALNDRVLITTRDGRQLDSGPVRAARGAHNMPLKRTELSAKFRDCLEAGGIKAGANEAFDMIMSLEHVGTAGQLMKALEGPY
jgi:2-methylcitrate dehydratase PrpD